MSKELVKWICSRSWCIEIETLEAIIGMMKTSQSLTELQQAILGRSGDDVPDSYRMMVRSNVAIIPIYGTIFSRSALYSWFFGGTQVQGLAQDITMAVENPDINAIVLNIDSPGGEITGVAEAADMIFAARSKKPVISYVYGLGASAAYWFASQGSRIVATDTGRVGSIGVGAAYQDWSKYDERVGLKEIEIVSSQSPKKWISPATPEGRALVQRRVDELADVFVGRVARGRGVTVNDVLTNYGQGDVYVAQTALDAGMIDDIGSLEQIIEEYSSKTLIQGVTMNVDELKAKHPDTYQAVFGEGKAAGKTEAESATSEMIATARAEGASAERERIQSIESISHPGASTIITENKFKPEMTKEAVALMIVEAESAASKRLGEGRAADGKALADKTGKLDAEAPQETDSLVAAAKEAAKQADNIAI